MALLFIDGFDHYQTSDIPKKYSESSQTPTILPTGGRRGGGCLYINRYDESVTKGIASSSTIIVGGAFIVTGRDFVYNNDGVPLFTTVDSVGNITAGLTASSTGALNIINGNGTVLGRSQQISTLWFGTTTWNYIEWKMQIADSIPANSCIVRVNGVEVLNLPAGTDTRYSTQATTISGVRLSGYGGLTVYGGIITVDDFYICNTVGNSPTDFLGDIRVDTLLPTADGTYNDGIPSTGTDSWSILDTVPPIYTQYVSLTNTGEKESLQFGNLSPITSQTIYGIQVDLDSSKSDAGTKIVAPIALSNAVLGEAANTALATGYFFATGILTTDPNTSTAWDESGVNAAEFGIVIK
jgi:hypothetical protein